MENFTLNLTSVWNQLLGAFPIGLLLFFFLKRHFAKQDEKEAHTIALHRDMDRRLEAIESRIDEIRLSLAEMGVKTMRETIDEIKRQNYYHESQIAALFRIADKEKAQSILRQATET